MFCQPLFISGLSAILMSLTCAYLAAAAWVRASLSSTETSAGFIRDTSKKAPSTAQKTDKPVMSGEKQIAVVLIQQGPIAPDIRFRPGGNAVPRRWSLMQRLTTCKMFMSRIIFAEIINNYENYITFIHTVLTVIKNIASNNVWT